MDGGPPDGLGRLTNSPRACRGPLRGNWRDRARPAPAGGFQAELFCESDSAAEAVLRARFPGTPLHPDVRTLRSLPRWRTPPGLRLLLHRRSPRARVVRGWSPYAEGRLHRGHTLPTGYLEAGRDPSSRWTSETLSASRASRRDDHNLTGRTYELESELRQVRNLQPSAFVFAVYWLPLAAAWDKLSGETSFARSVLHLRARVHKGAPGTPRPLDFLDEASVALYATTGVPLDLPGLRRRADLVSRGPKVAVQKSDVPGDVSPERPALVRRAGGT